VFGYQKLDNIVDKTVSVVIPCHCAHAKYLKECLERFANSTVIPDEIIISVSEAYKVQSEIHMLVSTSWPFYLKILQWNEKIDAAGNRNRASEIASSDVIICQDADDLPSLNRVEVIKYFFMNYNVELLVHTLFQQVDVPRNYDEIETIVPYRVNRPYPYGNGCPAYTQKVFKKVRWPEKVLREDIKFIRRALRYFWENSIVLNVNLYEYRNSLTVTN